MCIRYLVFVYPCLLHCDFGTKKYIDTPKICQNSLRIGSSASSSYRSTVGEPLHRTGTCYTNFANSIKFSTICSCCWRAVTVDHQNRKELDWMTGETMVKRSIDDARAEGLLNEQGAEPATVATTDESLMVSSAAYLWVFHPNRSTIQTHLKSNECFK